MFLHKRWPLYTKGHFRKRIVSASACSSESRQEDKIAFSQILAPTGLMDTVSTLSAVLMLLALENETPGHYCKEKQREKLWILLVLWRRRNVQNKCSIMFSSISLFSSAGSCLWVSEYRNSSLLLYALRALIFLLILCVSSSMLTSVWEIVLVKMCRPKEIRNLERWQKEEQSTGEQLKGQKKEHHNTLVLVLSGSLS